LAGPHPDRLVTLLDRDTEVSSLLSLAAGSPTLIKATQGLSRPKKHKFWDGWVPPDERE
jgi:hypothetical protein